MRWGLTAEQAAIASPFTFKPYTLIRCRAFSLLLLNKLSPLDLMASYDCLV